MGICLDYLQLTPGCQAGRQKETKQTLDNSAWRRGSNLFCPARPALQGFAMCVGKGRNDPQRGGICGTTCVVPPHHLDCVCVCVVVFTFFWAGNAILGLLKGGLLSPLFRDDDDHARRRRRGGEWLAGWLAAWSGPPPIPSANNNINKPRSTEEL